MKPDIGKELRDSCAESTAVKFGLAICCFLRDIAFYAFEDFPSCNLVPLVVNV